MATEAEFERLYQEFIRQGGGTHTFDNSNVTPVEYKKLIDLELTDTQREELDLLQKQYNDSVAYEILQDEITKFQNPYANLCGDGSASFDSFNTNLMDLCLKLDELDTVNPAAAESAREELSTQFGVSMTDLCKVNNLAPEAKEMYHKVCEHTNEQIIDFPDKVSEASNFASVAVNFNPPMTTRGAGGGECSIFKQLMGIMSGVMDGAFGFLGNLPGMLMGLMNPLEGMLGGLIGQIQGMIDGLIPDISSMLGGLQGLMTGIPDLSSIMGQFSGLMGGGFGAIGDITNQLLGEIAGIEGLQSQLAAMLPILNIGSIANNPCALGALLNAGTSLFGNAMTQLTGPTFSPQSLGIPTELDSRANASDVQSALSLANKFAATAPGVPQSPITSFNMAYEPFSAYLHEVTSTANTADANILSGGIGDILGSIFSNNSSNAVGPQLDQTPTRNVHIVKSRSWKEYSKIFSDDILSARNDSKKLRAEIENALAFAEKREVYNNDTESLVLDARNMAEALRNVENDLSASIQRSKKRLSYTLTENVYRDDDKEEISTTLYNDEIQPQTTRLVKRAKKLIADTQINWQGIQYRSVFLY